jgi:hypothetical protein
MNVMGNSEIENTNQPIDQTENIPVEKTTETESTITEKDPPNKKLWEKLNTTKNKNGITYYTGSYEEFNKKYSSKESIDSMFNLLKDEKVLNDDENSFYSQYYPELKKKDGQPSLNGGKDGISPTQSASQSQSVKVTEEIKTPELPKYNPEEEETHNDALNLINRRKKLEKDIEATKNGTLKLDKDQTEALMKKYASVQKKLTDQKLDSPNQAVVEKELEGLDKNIPDDEYRAMLSDLRTTNPSSYYSWIGHNKAYNLLDDESAYKLEKLWETSGMKIAKSKDQGLVEPTNAEDYMPNFKKGLSNLDNYLKESNKIIDESKLDDAGKEKAKNDINAAAANYVYSYATPDVAKDILSEKVSGTLEYKEPKLIPNPAADPDAEIKTFGSVKYDPNAPQFIEQKDSDFSKDNDLDNYSLTSIQAKLDPNSTVDKMIFDAYSQKKGMEDAFTEAKNNPKYKDPIADAAINYAISLDPKLQEYYKALGGNLPTDVVAQLTESFINNPTVQNIALKKGYANDLTAAKENFYQNFPNYSKNKVASIISQDREDSGENNAVINLPSQESVDKTVAKLVQEGKLDEKQAEIYKTEIRGDLDFLHYLGRTVTAPIGGAGFNKNPIETQDLIGGISEGYAGVLKGIEKTSLALLGVTPVGKLAKQYTDLGQTLFTDKARLARMMSDNTVGHITPVGSHGVFHGMGSFAGMAAGLALGGAEFKALGLGVETAGELAAVQGFLGDEYEKALMNHPGETIKDYSIRGASTLLHLGVMTIGAKFLPINKATEGLAKITNSNVDKVIEKFAAGTLSIKEAKESIAKLTANYLKEAGGHALTSGTTLTAINAMNSLTGKLLGENTQDVSQIANEAVDNFIPTVISTGLVSGFAALGSAKSNLTAKNIWDIANNPEYYLDRLDKMAEKNPKIKQSIDDIKDNIKIVSEANENLKDKNFDDLSKEQKQKYLYLTVQEKALLKKATSLSSDPTLAKKFADKAQELSKQKEDIINNKDKATELTSQQVTAEQGKEMELSPFVVNGKKVTEQEFNDAVKNTPNEAFEYTGNDPKYTKMVEDIGGKTVEYFWNEEMSKIPEVGKKVEELNAIINKGGAEGDKAAEELDILKQDPEKYFSNQTDIVTKIKATYDTENKPGVSSTVGGGETTKQGESIKGTGAEATGTGGVLQAQGTEGEGQGVENVGEKVTPIKGVEQEQVIKQMTPFTDKMVDIEREFKNNGFEINTDYDNEIQVLDKKGEMVEPDELPDNLKKLAADYEKATMKLGDFDASAREKALNQSRGIIDIKAEVVEPKKTELPEQKVKFSKTSPTASVESTTEKINPLDNGKGIDNKDFQDYDGMFSKNNASSPFITDILNDEVNGKRGYQLFYKRKMASIEMMSPEEYLKRVTQGQKSTEEGQKRMISQERKDIVKAGIEKGNKIDMPSLSYDKEGEFDTQEGRHRATIAKERGEKLIPVVIEKSATEKDLMNKAQEIVNEANKDLKTDDINEIINHAADKFNLHRDAIAYLKDNASELKVELPEQKEKVKFKKEPTEKENILNTKEEKETDIVDQMNSMDLVNHGVDLSSNLTTTEKIDVNELNSRLDNPLNTVEWSDFEGIPFTFTISDQLRTGDITNPNTGEIITDLKGGIGFNGTKGNENNAWANTTKEEAESMLQRAKDVYENNKALFEKLWKEGKLPDGHIPMAVVKMAESSILSNEAVFRTGIQNIETLPKANRKKAVSALAISMKDKIDTESKSLKRGVDKNGKPYTENTIKLKKKAIGQYQKILDAIKKNKYEDIVDVLKDKDNFSLPEKALIANEIFYGSPTPIGGKEIDISRSRPNTPVSKVLIGNKNPALINLGKITDLLTEPSMKNVPNMHIVSIVGIDIKNPKVNEINHTNYPYGVKGKSIGILENPVHMKDAFGEAYGSALAQVTKNEAEKASISQKGALTQGIPVQSGLPNRVFKPAIAKGQLDAVDKLAGFLRQAFPNTTFFTSKQAWDEAMADPSIKKHLKDGDIVYAFTTDGNVFINPELKTTKATLHDTGHIWMSYVKDNNPALHSKGLDLVTDTKEHQKAIEEYGDTELAREEALMELMATKGETILDAAQKAKFKEWLLTVYKYIADKFKSLQGLTPEQIQDVTLDKFLEGMLADILSGKELTTKKVKGEAKFSKEKAPAEPEVPEQKEEETGISKKALKDKYGFVQTFDVKSDQEVADNAMNNLATSATKNKMSLDEQAENDMLGMIDKTGEASEQDIMTAAYYLNSLDKKIEAANENGENANVLLAKRQAALEILRRLGNNAGRNLRLFGNVYKNVEGNKLEAVRAELKKNLGVSDIPSSIADLKKSKLSDQDKQLIEPYVKAIEKLNEDLNDIKTKLNKETKAIDQAELEEYIKKELEKRLQSQNAPTTPTSPTDKKTKILQSKGKEWADKLRTLKIQKGQTPLDVTFGLRNLAIEAVAQIVEKGATIAEAIKQVLLDKKFAGLTEESLTNHIIKSIDIAENKDIAMNKIKETAANSNSQTITQDMVDKGYIKKVVDAFINSDIPYNEIIKEATNELKTILPEVTEKEVTDALLKRNEFKPKTKKQLDNEAKQKLNDIKRLEKSKSELDALEAGIDVSAIQNNNKLSAEEKKKQIEKRKSDFEKEVDAKIKKIQDDKKEADKKAEELKKEKDKADAEAKRIKDRIAILTKQLNDIKAGVVKVSTPREKEAPEIEDLKQQIKDAVKEKAEKKKIDELTKKLNDLQAGIRPTPSAKKPSQDSPEVARLKQQIKDADKQLREVENARNKNIRDQKNVNDKLKSLNEQIEYVKNNKKVFNTAINNPRQANEKIKDAKEKLKDAYNQAGIRLESGNKNEIKIAQEAEKAIKEFEEDKTLSEEVKKEHIEDIKKQRDKDLQGTKQSVLSSLKDKVDAKIEEIKNEINDAIDDDIDYGDNNEIISLNEIKTDLNNLSSNLSPSKENLKDQIDKADQDLTSLINQYKGTEYENYLIEIQKEFRDSWQKTSDEIQRQMVIDKENRRRKEIERKINAGQYTEMPITPFDSKRDIAAAAAEAETKKAWSRLNSLSTKAKEQQETKGAVSKWLKFRRDWMVMTPGAIGKVAGSAITKPIIDPAIRQTFGKIAGSITGVKPVDFTDIGKTFAQIKSPEAADKYLKDANENYVQSFIEHKQAVEKFGEDSKEAKDAKSKLDNAELTKNSAIAYLFIAANSSIDIRQIIMKGATDFDASMGKYKQSVPSERTKMQNAWFWIESINRTHSAMKSISHRQALMEEFMENLQYVQGRDGTITEQGRQEAWDLAVLRSESGRFGEDTWASRTIGKLKGSEKGWVRNIGNWTFPVAKVGINITKQGLDMAFPGAELAYKAYHENIIKEFDKLPLQQKKYINTLITRGLFGLAQYAIVGYLLANGGMKYGGAYNPEDRQKVMGSDGKVLEHGQWEIGGVRMPEAFNMIFNHSPYCLPASIATVGYQQSKKGEYYKAVTGIINEVYERLPFQATADIVAGLTGKKYKLEQIVANEVPTMKTTAEYFDKDEEGNTREVKTNGDNFAIDVMNKVGSRIPIVRNYMEEKPILFKDSEIDSNKELNRMTAAGIQLPDIGTKTFAVAVDENHPDGEMTAQEKTKFLQKVKSNYIKEINGILNEKWEGTDQKTGQVVIALGSELGKYKGDVQRATTAIQEMSNQALTKSWTNAYKEMGLEKGATTEYKWEKIGDILFDDKSVKENSTLKQLKDSGIQFNKIEAKSDIKVDKGEMTDSEYETYKKEYRERALLEIDEVLTIPQLKTEYLQEAKKNIATGEYVSGLEELNKIKVVKNNKEISLLQDKIDEALSGLKRKILIDMRLVTPEKSWKKATDIPDLDRTIEQ